MQDIVLNIEKELDEILCKNIKKNNYNKKILILAGGGTKGLTYFGAFKAFEELGILENIHTFATTSVGSFIACFYLLGYTIKEMEEFLYLFDFKKFTKITSINDISPIDIFKNYGIDDGNNFYKVFNILLKSKGIKEDITLLEFYKLTKKNISNYHKLKQLYMMTTTRD